MIFADKVSVKTFAEKIIAFNKKLSFKGTLPAGINIMNPFKESECALAASECFYNKYYNDINKRYAIFGINPGRFGGGVTGVPFTDTKRLLSECDITCNIKSTHEPSSVYVYEMINAYGGVYTFYQRFYINSLCPLGFTSTIKTNKEVNYNYYDSKELTAAVLPFIIKSVQHQIAVGLHKDVCFCFGTGKNENFFRKLNEEYKFFKKIIALEHPRFIMQYKTKSKQLYIEKYLKAFSFTDVTGENK